MPGGTRLRSSSPRRNRWNKGKWKRGGYNSMRALHQHVKESLTIGSWHSTLCSMQVTIELADGLAQRLRPQMNRLPEIIERGLQHRGAGTSANCREIIACLARGPRPYEILALRPAEHDRN